MVGWKRIVITVSAKIDKAHLTHAAAEIVAMFAIGAADQLGLLFWTTHVLSSGVAGTMAVIRKPTAAFGATPPPLITAEMVPGNISSLLFSRTRNGDYKRSHCVPVVTSLLIPSISKESLSQLEASFRISSSPPNGGDWAERGIIE